MLGQMKNEDLADLLIQRLNIILAFDRNVVTKLCEHRECCNDTLARHPEVIVSETEEPEPQPEVGMLGILNGLVGCVEQGPYKGSGLITAVYGDGGIIQYFFRTNNRVEGTVLPKQHLEEPAEDH